MASSPERRLLSVGGSETPHSCHFVFVLRREPEERPALRPGQRSAVKITAPSSFFLPFSKLKTQTGDRWRLIFHHHQDIFQLLSISRSINIAVIPVIILLLLDAPQAEKNVFLFLIQQDCKSFLSRAKERTVGTELRPAYSTVQTDIRGIHHRVLSVYSITVEVRSKFKNHKYKGKANGTLYHNTSCCSSS